VRSGDREPGDGREGRGPVGEERAGITGREVEPSTAPRLAFESSVVIAGRDRAGDLRPDDEMEPIALRARLSEARKSSAVTPMDGCLGRLPCGDARSDRGGSIGPALGPGDGREARETPAPPRCEDRAGALLPAQPLGDPHRLQERPLGVRENELPRVRSRAEKIAPDADERDVREGLAEVSTEQDADRPISRRGQRELPKRHGVLGVEVDPELSPDPPQQGPQVLNPLPPRLAGRGLPGHDDR